MARSEKVEMKADWKEKLLWNLDSYIETQVLAASKDRAWNNESHLLVAETMYDYLKTYIDMLKTNEEVRSKE